MLFAKYATKPKSWKEACKTFRVISLQLHPDKGGDSKIYQQLVGELEDWKNHFQNNPMALDKIESSETIIKLQELDAWLRSNRGNIISFVRAALSTPVMIKLPDNLRDEIFLSKVLLIDVALLWATEWSSAYAEMRGAREAAMSLVLDRLPGLIINEVVVSGLRAQTTSVTMILKSLWFGLRFPGKEPDMPRPSERLKGVNSGMDRELGQESKDRMQRRTPDGWSL